MKIEKKQMSAELGTGGSLTIQLPYDGELKIVQHGKTLELLLDGPYSFEVGDDGKTKVKDDGK